MAWMMSAFNNMLGLDKEPGLARSTAATGIQPGGDIPAADQWTMGPKTCPMQMSAYQNHRRIAKVKGKPWNCASPTGGRTVDGAAVADVGERDLFYSNSPRREGRENLFLRGSASAEVQNVASAESLRGNASIGLYTRAEDTMYGAQARDTPDNVTTMPYASTGAQLAPADW